MNINETINALNQQLEFIEMQKKDFEGADESTIFDMQTTLDNTARVVAFPLAKLQWIKNRELVSGLEMSKAENQELIELIMNSQKAYTDCFAAVDLVIKNVFGGQGQKSVSRPLMLKMK